MSRLCRAYPTLIPAIAGLSLSRSAGGSVPRFASDPLIAELQKLQDTLGEGPARDAARLRQPVQAGDLKEPSWQQRWPRFAPAARAAGVRAVYALPLHAGGTRHDGALTVYRDTPGAWDDTQQTAVETFAAAATELLTLHQRGLDLTGAFTDAHRDHGILLLAAGAPAGPQPGLATDPGPGLPLIRWFQQQALPAIRAHLHTIAGHALPDDDRYRFVLAVHEAMSNTVLHGGGHGQLLLWHSEQRLWCEISDHGPGIALPEQRPGPDTGGARAAGHGLRLIQQAATSLDITTDATGTRLLLSYRLNQRRTGIDAQHAGSSRPSTVRYTGGGAGYRARRTGSQHQRRPADPGRFHGRCDRRP
ncbi:ATP-binding protein [Actinoplanes aureus]|uniref:ATP-binding protein n=1 Tax=Actinoplanes aureus TaxID=2792083 RepID=A0A931C9T8_9ACTN|nr:ATP-binding protein [Actinoplanes aureus]MBG0566045.1 ATP-binding protein [Actinoplanes aureus]